MSEKQIKDLTEVTSLNSGDVFAIDNTSNNTRKITKSNLEASLSVSASPAGSDEQIQFNDNGSLGANSNFVFDGTHLGIGVSNPTAELHIVSHGIDDTVFICNSNTGSEASPVINMKRDSSTPSNGDYLGQFKFQGENDIGQQVVYAKITAKIGDITDGTEDGLIEMALKVDGTNLIVSRQTASALKLINGNGLEVEGNIGAGLTNAQAFIDIAASTSDNAQLRFRAGANPSSPSAGEMWFDGTNLKFNDGTTTIIIV